MSKTASKFTVGPSMKRGDTIARNGVAGLFVGVDRIGLLWVAWEPEAFDRMCKAFDAFQSK